METWDVIAIFIFIWIYFLPSVIAIETDKKNKVAIVLVNVLFWLTIIWWFIALIWSVMKD